MIHDGTPYESIRGQGEGHASEMDKTICVDWAGGYFGIGLT